MAAFGEGRVLRNECVIDLRGVSKDFASGPSTVHALRPATMALNRGEFVLLEGPSGSGKTTLLSIMGLLLQPSAGQIEICGTRVTGLSEDKLPSFRLKHVGFIFQSYNLFPALSAIENIKLILKLKGYSWSERRKEAPRLLERVGLEDCMHRKPSDLSGGQRQRVCIARALAGDSDVILADEPTAALDTKTGIEIIELLRDEARSGRKAVLVVTHDPRLEKYATRLDRISDGVHIPGAPMPRRTRTISERRPAYEFAH